MEKFTFDIQSGRVNLSDPCYAVGTWCGAFSLPAKNGEWIVEPEERDMGKWGNRVASFTVCHKDHADALMNVLEFDFGVDSGQFGIFDSEIYEGDSDYNNEDGFYRECCDTTLSENRLGAVRNRGFVSSTGFGDGGYTGYGAFDNDELVKFKIVFIGENED